jgi:peptidyl-prolyl cis-trans isomerase C
MTKTIVFTVALSLAALTSMPVARAQDAKTGDKMIELFGDPVIAKGKNVEVKRSQLDSSMVSLKAAAAGRNQPLPPEAENFVLKELIIRQILLARATDADRTKGKELFTEALGRMQTESKLATAEFDERLNRQIKAQGMTRDKWNEQNTEQAIIQAMLERELKVSVTTEQAKKFYDENPSKFERPESVRASHVLIATKDLTSNTDYSDEKKTEKRKLAESIQKRAKAGEDFAKLVRDFSDDTASKGNNGEYTFGRGQMVPEFEKAAYALGTNEVSEIVTTMYGFHIIKLSEKNPATKVEFSEVEKPIMNALKGDELQKLMPDFVEGALTESKVEVLDSKLKLPEPPKKKDAKESDTAAKPAEKK